MKCSGKLSQSFDLLISQNLTFAYVGNDTRLNSNDWVVGFGKGYVGKVFLQVTTTLARNAYSFYIALSGAELQHGF